MLFRWFVALSINDAVWNHSTLSENQDHLLEHEVMSPLFVEVTHLGKQRGLLLKDHD